MNPIEVRDLHVRYGWEYVLADVSWTVRPGEFWAVVGPNGSGKTTLLKAILGLLAPQQGEALLYGVPARRFADWRRVGYLPQFGAPQLPDFPASVREVVALGLLSCAPRFARLGRLAHDPAVEAALSLVNMCEWADHPIGGLSGGQWQRTVLARALVHRPDLLLLDEPAAALDPEMRERFYRVLGEWRHERGTTIVMVTHDFATAGEHADHLLFLDRAVIFRGTFAEFCRDSDMAGRFGANVQHAICHQHPAKGAAV